MKCEDCLHYRVSLRMNKYCDLVHLYLRDGQPLTTEEGCIFEPIDL